MDNKIETASEVTNLGTKKLRDAARAHDKVEFSQKRPVQRQKKVKVTE